MLKKAVLLTLPVLTMLTLSVSRADDLQEIAQAARMESEINQVAQEELASQDDRDMSDDPEEAAKPQTVREARKAYRKWKRENPIEAKETIEQYQEFRKRILSDLSIQKQLTEILKTCETDQAKCNEDFKLLFSQVTGSVTTAPVSAGMPDLLSGTKGTFGICSYDKTKSSKFHAVVYSKKAYACKLSTLGKVFDKTATKKIYGPGLSVGAPSMLMACSGKAYGTTNVGFEASAGAYYGLSLGTTVGGAGVCVTIAVGKLGGAHIGANVTKFEN